MTARPRRFARVVAGVFTACVLTFNLRLHARPDGSEARSSLAFVRASLDDGAASRMQRYFPEGYFFTYALYGLAWVDLGMASAPDGPERAAAVAQARYALAAMDSDAARAPFATMTAPRYGVFYLGWSAWLRAGALMLEPRVSRSPSELSRLRADCATLRDAFARSPTPFLQAYPGQSWPVDSTVAMAALSVWSRLDGEDITAVRARWLSQVAERLDARTGMIPHQTTAGEGAALDGPRGSSQSIMLRTLPEVDAALADAQYTLFRRHFVTTVLGFPGVREHPIGVDRGGDVDSGPLIFGVSMSATVVSSGGARLRGDGALAGPLSGTMEAFGLPITLAGRKRYAFGVLPVGDAFIAWSQTARGWDGAPARRALNLPVAKGFPWVQNAAGGLLVALAWAIALRRRRP